MNTQNRINRRKFLKLGVAAGGSAIALTAIPINLVASDEVAVDEPLAQAMGYVKDASTVDTSKFPKRAGEAGAKQFAKVRGYTEESLIEGVTIAVYAPCSIFQNRLVRGAGWCNAWVAKA